MQKVRRHTFPLLGIVLRPLVSVWFQVLLTQLSLCFSSFNRPTCSLSVIEEYLALAGGPAGFTRSFTSSVLLWYASQQGPVAFAYGTFTLFGRTFQTIPLTTVL